MEVTCPSGLRGEIRELIVADEDKLAAGANDPKADYFGLLEDMVANCWTRTIDAGAYGEMAGLVIERMIPADIEYLIVQVRHKSWGDDFEVHTLCPNGHEVAGIVKCSAVECTPLNPAVAERFKRGENEVIVLPSSGRKVEFTLLTRGLDRRITKSQDTYPKERATHALLGRIVTVEGFDGDVPIDAETKMGLHEWIQQMPSRDAMALRSAFKETDPAIDTDVTVACKCGTSAEENMLLCPDFFVPTETN